MKKLVHLEAARGIGAIIVASWHILPFFFYLVSDPLIKALMIPVIGPLLYGAVFFFFDGALAVHFFFVLSGYVLSVRYFSGDGSYDLQKAAFRRYIRLALPVFGSSLFAFLLIKSGFFYLHEVAQHLYAGQAVMAGEASFYQTDHSVLTMLRAAFLESMFDFRFASSLNPVLWTINVEFYGSLLLFAVLAVTSRFRWPLLALGAVLVFLGLFARMREPLIFYYYYADILLGMIYAFGSTRFAVVTDNRFRLAKSVIGNALILAGCVAGGMDFIPFFASVAGNSLAGNVIFLGVLVSPQYRELMSGRVSRLLGRLSFAIYLLHYPIIISLYAGTLHGLVELRGWSLEAALAVATCLYFPVLAIVSLLFARYVDAPSIALSKRLADSLYLRGTAIPAAVQGPTARE
ncbi:MAG: acyltransferase [Rhizobiales bacterium]|nr:acyltransferase [Hyphomicrobiales bacterium]